MNVVPNIWASWLKLCQAVFRWTPFWFNVPPIGMLLYITRCSLSTWLFKQRLKSGVMQPVHWEHILKSRHIQLSAFRLKACSGKLVYRKCAISIKKFFYIYFRTLRNFFQVQHKKLLFLFSSPFHFIFLKSHKLIKQTTMC